MYGLIIENFSCYLKHKYGDEAWEQVRNLANLDSPTFSIHQVSTENTSYNENKLLTRAPLGFAPRSTVLPAWLAPLAAKRSVASLPHNAIGHTQALRYPFGTIYQPGHADTRTGRTHNILCTKRSPLIV